MAKGKNNKLLKEAQEYWDKEIKEIKDKQWK
jgi:hypothetical protein